MSEGFHLRLESETQNSLAATCGSRVEMVLRNPNRYEYSDDESGSRGSDSTVLNHDLDGVESISPRKTEIHNKISDTGDT